MSGGVGRRCSVSSCSLSSVSGGGWLASVPLVLAAVSRSGLFGSGRSSRVEPPTVTNRDSEPPPPPDAATTTADTTDAQGVDGADATARIPAPSLPVFD